jgi:hypothetical protein
VAALHISTLIRKAEIVTEISFSFPNEVGILAKTAKAISKAGIGIKGMLNVSRGSSTETFLVVSKNLETVKKILKEHGVKNIGEGTIVSVELEGETGALAEMAERLAKAKVNIENIYVSEAALGPSVVFLSTSDDDAAVQALLKA